MFRLRTEMLEVPQVSDKDALSSPPSGKTAQNTTRYPFNTPCRVSLGGSAHVMTASSDVTEMARTF